ncbi:DUF2637 domain-containing protein [Streptomyces sp. NPDC052415]|uniref:DUF2637 domain-containing protein n=1 Tax=Streptomyces sp. NPDC052415 TaxID=3365690 RepID=UPI0037D25689
MVVFGAVIIAGIGFAGSYAAVRELALHKGFGNFSYVFPIGIDAGICVLLALDLLLTWIRIPLPLLRQTAWLLTAATIAFNGAAAWPDPTGVGMHGVIPILFVVSVEAARHAIGRIADITADKHMEGIRPTRWLLSPVPTFLLWRRMKLWELRSYEQVIKLEQERLVYQARLRSHYGRAWRRKAPVESLMPLRLAKYGVPLAETAPAGLAAAGIKEPLSQYTNERVPAPTQPESSALDAAAEHEQPAAEPESATTEALRAPVTPRTERTENPHEPTTEDTEHFVDAHQAFPSHLHAEPIPHQWATRLRDTHDASTPTGAPTCEDQAQPLPQAFQTRHALNPQAPAATATATATATEESVPAGQGDDSRRNARPTDQQQQGAHPEPAALESYVREQHSTPADGGRPLTGDDPAACDASFQEHEHGSRQPTLDETGAVLPEHATTEPLVDAAIDEVSPGGPADLTTVDRYYLAWIEYKTQNVSGSQSSTQEAEELSAYLASKGLRGRGGKPVSPATLRRYLLPFRVYTIWAEQRAHSDVVSLDAVAKECATQGITAQYNKPLNTDYLADQAVDFERRWQALHRSTAQ